jgi:hypothetical protein
MRSEKTSFREINGGPQIKLCNMKRSEMTSREKHIADAFAKLRLQIREALITRGHHIEWKDGQGILSVDGIEINLVVLRSHTRRQSRYGDHLSDKEPVYTYLQWGVDKHELQKTARKEIKNFDVSKVVERVENWLNEMRVSIEEKSHLDALIVKQDRFARECCKAHGLDKGSRVRVLSEFRQEGYEVMIRRLDQSEVQPLLQIIMQHMNKVR